MTECTETSPNYESQFAHRFTEEDEAFQQYVLRPQSQPPVVEAWRPRGGGFQRGRDNRFQGSRQQGGPEWDGGWDRGRGRGRGQEGGGSQRWTPRGGYHNSYNQRSHYGRY
ncbi:hypothetical protein P4O66_018652 [Electrophorus voltai]|uniref:RNA guanine-7 methyltransferase activating subunit n=1 Tax=Electrophorus voltai TaxID=2609070 RepID=A0AAD8YSU4_9TELE|nr:RNA guanine-N7 methyltransferase activating subunit [Electrophorus electricus]XP_026865677.1 RNA guanine-N7 methyltransferase activating subunit [Electrophorus electricus]KAK1785259.1 hypothetical protein P4O66_018652 [Electrophorus voltai]